MATQLTLGDLKLGLKNLFEHPDKLKLFSSTRTAGLYEPELRDAHDALNALPVAVGDTGRPLSEQLATTDDEHDGYGLAIFYLSMAYASLPDAPPAVRKVVDLVATRVIAAKAETTEAYPVEAGRAIERHAQLPAMKAELKSIPVVGGTLYDWVAKYTEHGVRLHELLAQRADHEAQAAGGADRSSAPALRSQIVGTLRDTRRALAAEVKRNAKLPRNLDAQIFGYFDELLRQRREREAAAHPVAHDPAPPESPDK